MNEETEFELEVRFLDEAAVETSELVSPNSLEYESLIERIVDRKWGEYYQANS